MNDGQAVDERRERSRARSRASAKFQREQTKLNGRRRVDARSMARNTPKRYGVCAERVYTCDSSHKRGVQHFSV